MLHRRHPAEVTSDRLADAVERWHEWFTPQEQDMVAAIRRRLQGHRRGRQPPMADIKVGDKVAVFDGGRAHQGQVVRVGRTLIDIKYRNALVRNFT